MQKGPAEWYEMQVAGVSHPAPSPRPWGNISFSLLLDRSILFFMSGEEPSAAYTFTKSGHIL